MTAMTKYLQRVLAWAFVGAVLMTHIAPSISRLLITAPKSFGMNCEPAADWSVMALIRGQVIGLALGAILAVVTSFYWRAKPKKGAPASEGPQL